MYLIYTCIYAALACCLALWVSSVAGLSLNSKLLLMNVALGMLFAHLFTLFWYDSSNAEPV
jgi:hypothetical protein